MRQHDAGQRLIVAALEGDATTLEHLLATDADVNFADTRGNTALIIASEKGYTHIVAMLLTAGADVDAETEHDCATALTVAMYRNHLRVVQQLLAANASVDHIDARGNQPLIRAVECHQTDCVRLLLGAGADVNATNLYENTALICAARRGFTEILEILLAVDGVDMEYTNVADDTALLRAAKKGHIDAVEMLCTAGANVHHVNANGETALLYASRCGEIDMVERLLARGVAVDHADCAVHRRGLTPLSYACKRGHVTVVEMLLATGEANVNHRNSKGETPLGLTYHADVMKILLAHGANVDDADRNTTSALNAACREGHVDAVALLVSSGADVNATDPFGYSPLERAVMNRTDEFQIVEMLLATGIVDVHHVAPNGCSALILAAKYANVMVFTKLLDEKEGTNTTDAADTSGDALLESWRPMVRFLREVNQCFSLPH